MGAAGLTCSTCETAARAGTGIEIELGLVPQRAPNMTPYEIMLSESQERMLIIVHAGREEEVKRIFDKWDLPWAQIGRVTDTGRMVVKSGGRVVVDIPAKKLADEAPVYQPESREPAYLQAVRAVHPRPACRNSRTPPPRCGQLLAWPTIASKNWVYRQYDHMVRDGSVVCPGSDAAVIRIKEDSLPAGAASPGGPASEKFIALTRGLQRRLRLSGPVRRRQNRRGRSGPQSGLFRRHAPGRDGQSQFRQPAQPGTFLAASRNPCAAWPKPAAPSRRPVTGGNCQPIQSKPQRPH